MANGKTLISCGFAGFWACFDLLITNQLLYRLSYSSIFEVTKVFYHTSWKKSIKIHAQFIYFRGSGHYNKNIPHFNGERTE